MTHAIIQDEQNGVKFYGPAREFWAYKGLEVMLSGPYETGKTFAALTKLHALMCKYSNARGLMTRETYADLVNTAVVTYEKKVLPVPPEDIHSGVSKFGGEKPQFYDYPNGARLVVAGLDNPGKTLSAEYDFIYVNQTEEIDLNTWETLTRAVTGRAGNAPYTQIMGDCNPSHPSHWILKRSLEGKIKLYQQMHEHNPVLFDQITGELTAQGVKTMATLDAMTGIRYLRGRKGLWVQAEGVIYDNFDPAEGQNVDTAAEYNPDYTVRWAVDDGYVRGQGPGTASYHPRVILFANITPQGFVHVFDEYYATGELSEVSIQHAFEKPYKRPEIAFIDSSAAELKARLWNSGVQTMGATHKVGEGIKNARRFMCDPNGVRMVKIHPRCVNLIQELQSYAYDADSHVSTAGERKPSKVDDHGADALRYLLWNLRYT